MKTRIILITMLAAGAAMAQQEEKRPERKPPTAADFIQRLDKDGDGLVSATEFDGPADHFAMMDTNGDGLISESEVLPAPSPKEMKPNEEKAEGANCGEGQCPKSPPEEKVEISFVQRFDQDADGKVSTEEFPGPAEHFTQLDVNSDGYITEDEAPKRPAGHPRPAAPPSAE